MTTILLSILFLFGTGVVTGQPADTPAPTDPSASAPSGAVSELEGEAQESAEEKPTTPPVESPDATDRKQAAGAEEDEEAELRPRFELHIPSVAHLSAQAKRSHTSRLGEEVATALTAGMSTSRGLSTEVMEQILTMIASWPDTALSAATFAPDAEGRSRWGMAFDWPLEDLHKRLAALLAVEGFEDFLEGVRLKQRDDGGWALLVAGSEDPLCLLLGREGQRSLVRSVGEFEFPDELYGQATARKKERKATSTVVYCRANLTSTEKDSTALFGSHIPWFQDIQYQASVRRNGNWSERFGVSWNMMVGTGVKNLLGISKAKQPFYVSREAFGAVVVNSSRLHAMLDVFGGIDPGTLAGKMGSRVGPDMCLLLLPGEGILPAPDVVFQTRARYGSAVLDDIRSFIEKANEESRKIDKPEAWHETKVNDRVVFYHDGRTGDEAGMRLVTFRKVLFIDEHEDPKGRQRNFLFLGLTTTSPEGLVRRLIKPSPEDGRIALPSSEKHDGQMWIHWKRLYEHAGPWINLGIAGISPDGVLSSVDRLSEALADSSVGVNTTYNGMGLRHRGPIPLGMFYIPTMMSAMLAPNMSGDTDLSRERIAVERLKLLHKHAELFRQDQGRWPVRVAELDGYIDFQGHSYLLKLRESSRPGWMDALGRKLEEEEEDEEEEEEEEEFEIDDSVYVVDWGEEKWTLGVAPKRLKHLAELYIDHEGTIHRTALAPAEDGSAAEAKPLTK